MNVRLLIRIIPMILMTLYISTSSGIASTQTTFSNDLSSKLKTPNENLDSPRNIELVGNIGNMAYDVAVQGNYAYVAAGTNGFSIIDISNPSMPVEIGHLDASTYECHEYETIIVKGIMAYAGCDSGQRILYIDISNPSHPIKFDAYLPLHMAEGYDVSGNYMYTSEWNIWHYYTKFCVVDLNTGRSIYDNYYPSYRGAVVVNGNYVYVSGFQILDISNPRVPIELGSFTSPYENDIEVLGNFAYAVGYEGLEIINIANKNYPFRTTVYTALDGGNGLAVSEDYVYIADGNAGLRVINITDKLNPIEVGYYDTLGSSEKVSFSNGYIFLADTSEGLLILKFIGNNSISGQIRNIYTNEPLSGVKVVDDMGHISITDSNGIYTLTNLDARFYTITPEKVSYAFSPTIRKVKVPPNGDHQDFIASGDLDGDNLYDVWEIFGYDPDGDGAIDVDLPKMGADPNHKDLFVEVDYMVEREKCIKNICLKHHSHQPDPKAIEIVVNAFKDAPVSNIDGLHGINLHVDFGSDTPMKPGSTWGELSRSNELLHKDEISWTDFNDVKNNPVNFDQARRSIFHYVIFAHFLAQSGDIGPCTSGQGPINAMDFIVSLGGWGSWISKDDCLPGPIARTGVGTALQQAGTFMHELGHNLGLHHGGGDPVNGKPNYLSIMNYPFQMTGLIHYEKSGEFDYSRSDQIPDLIETNLDENVGLNGGSSSENYGTTWICPNGKKKSTPLANNPIDWNCDESSNQSGILANVNNGWEPNPSPGDETLKDYLDWQCLTINNIGSNCNLTYIQSTPGIAAPTEITLDLYNQIPRLYDIGLVGFAGVTAYPGYSTVYNITLSNNGFLTDTYTLIATPDRNWAQIDFLPDTLTLGPGETQDLEMKVHIPLEAKSGEVDAFVLNVTSTGNPRVFTDYEFQTAVIYYLYLPFLSRSP